VVSGENGISKNGTGNNGTGNKGTNGKVGKNGAFSILGFAVGLGNLASLCYFYLNSCNIIADNVNSAEGS